MNITMLKASEEFKKYKTCWFVPNTQRKISRNKNDAGTYLKLQ